MKTFYRDHDEDGVRCFSWHRSQEEALEIAGGLEGVTEHEVSDALGALVDRLHGLADELRERLVGKPRGQRDTEDWFGVRQEIFDLLRHIAHEDKFEAWMAGMFPRACALVPREVAKVLGA